MSTIVIEFMDGATKHIDAQYVHIEDEHLSIKTSYRTASFETWEHYPITNIRRWTTSR